MRLKIENLRLAIDFVDFKDKIQVLLSEAEELRKLNITEDEKYLELEHKSIKWRENAYLVLQTSFNDPSNEIEYRFSIETHQLKTISKPDTSLFTGQKVKNRKDLILSASNALESLFLLVSVSESIIGFDEEKVKKINNLSSNERLFFIISKLASLPSQRHYPVHDILEGNGLRVSFSETMEMLILLKNAGYIDVYGRGWASLLLPGKLRYEEMKSEMDESSEKNHIQKNKNNSVKKIFISHATADQIIVTRFCDLILHNALNFDLTKQVFNTSLEGSKPLTGEDFRLRIKEELTSADLVLQFISEEYKKSEVCLNEMGAAWIMADYVVPLIIGKNNYEVGFIHNTTQQAQLNNISHLLKLADELQEKGFVTQVKNERLFAKVREFIDWLEIHLGETSEDKQTKSIIEKPTQGDLSMLINYMDSKKFTKMKMESIRENIHSKFTDDFLIKMVETFPDDLTRSKIQGKPAIQNLMPDFNF